MAPPSTKQAHSNSDEDEVQIDEGAVHDELGEDPEEAPNRTAKVQTQNAIISGNWSEFMVMRRLTTSK